MVNEERLHRIIHEAINNLLDYRQLLSSFTWQDVDFLEGDVGNDGLEQLVVTIKDTEIPTDAINIKAQNTRLGKIQLHTFIHPEFQRMGVATKIYNAFVHMFGSVYSGFGRVVNKEGIMPIYYKLDKEPDIEVKYILNSDYKPIGIEAKLKEQA